MTKGQSWYEASNTAADKLTNGSIMRVGPIGLLAWRAPSSQASWANGVLSSHVTHQAPLCKEGCAALGVAVAAAVQAKANAAEDPVAAVLEHLESRCPYTDYSRMLKAMLSAGAAAKKDAERQQSMSMKPDAHNPLGVVTIELQAAVDAMHATVPQNDLFKGQGYAFSDRFHNHEVTMFPPHTAGFAIYAF
eukprot:COSAG05_NODE_4034_length_1707_cov_1.266791_2_plen_190_part_01